MILILTRLYRLWKARTAPSVALADGPAAALARPRPMTSARRPSASSRGRASLLAHQVRYDLLASMRNPRARFFTIAFPILLLVIFAGVFGHGTTVVDGVRVKLDRFYVPGILAMSIIVAGYGNLVISISAARETGVLKRRRSTPVPPAVLIAGQALATLVTAVAMGVVLLVIARLAYGVTMSPAGIVAIACTVVVGTLTFACLGYAVSGMIGSPDAAQPVVQLTTLPLYFISAVWIPTTHLSTGLRHVASVFPVEHLAAALHLASVRSSFGSAFAPTDLLVLAAWALGAAAVAARRFSWLPSAAGA